MHKTLHGCKSDHYVILRLGTWKLHWREERREGRREKVDGGQRWFGNSNLVWTWDLKLWRLLC